MASSKCHVLELTSLPIGAEHLFHENFADLRLIVLRHMAFGFEFRVSVREGALGVIGRLTLSPN